MKFKIKGVFIILLFLNACQTSSEFDEFYSNTVDLTKITDGYSEPSILDSTLLSALVGVALLAALSSKKSTYSAASTDPSNLDSEWIE